MILDLIIYNYTNYYSYFFLNIINFKNIYYIIFISLIIDNIFLNTYFLVTSIMILLYFLLKMVNNYFLKNTICYFLFIIIMSLIYKANLFLIIKKSFILQIIFILLNYNHTYKYGK